MKNKLLTIIPARGGSKRIPKKNIKMFLGTEIIGYPIRAALQAGLSHDVIVSTDSEEIGRVALKFGASVPFVRSEKNSDDFATTFDVIQEVLDKVNKDYEFVCCIYPTSVFVTAEMIQQALRALKDDENATSIASVLQYSHPIQRSLSVKSSYLKSNHPECYNSRSQDLEINYHDAGQFYIFKAETVLEEKRLITKNCIPFVLDANKGQDIDTLEDWQIAEIMYKHMVDE
ncbi:pseudaminic acid cytidylyltransferase [Vibrio breoganii]|uniref:pseudaminic acid cytidylyltransferase n=1 Tax=Vibrio breoganii TaxID=553239 RepID=UPI000C855E4A|nr:pseudaminic acid cytidylyltransferase [Vibrio breoganii]PMG94672.1 pseudaminic acid cytidylyltransferase [Vibrio breoganii]PMK41089.1 pseudaminic acid cytidylyltransferase [Vibrio breoganii]